MNNLKKKLHKRGDLKDLRYTGTLDEVTIEGVLRASARSSDISFKMDKNNVILSN